MTTNPPLSALEPRYMSGDYNIVSYTKVSVDAREQAIANKLKEFWDDVCEYQPQLKFMCYQREFNAIIKELRGQK